MISPKACEHTVHDCIVVYDAAECPLCEMERELNEALNRAESAEEEVKQLQGEYEDLAQELHEEQQRNKE